MMTLRGPLKNFPQFSFGRLTFDQLSSLTSAIFEIFVVEIEPDKAAGHSMLGHQSGVDLIKLFISVIDELL